MTDPANNLIWVKHLAGWAYESQEFDEYHHRIKQEIPVLDEGITLADLKTDSWNKGAHVPALTVRVEAIYGPKVLRGKTGNHFRIMEYVVRDSEVDAMTVTLFAPDFEVGKKGGVDGAHIGTFFIPSE